MVDEKYLMISMDDSKAKAVSEVLGSKTCKKIIDYLAENDEASQKDLSDALNIPMNTMDYNMKKLIASGFVQKRSNFFWSKKGKKIVMYELSNKSIVISPRRTASEKIRSLVPGFMITLVGSFAFWVYEKIKSVPHEINEGGKVLMDKGYGALEAVPTIPEESINQAFSYSPGPLWLAFMLGGLTILFLYALLNWRKVN
jgi:DNA-binding Lrp family transcriptional regulator